MNPLAPFGWVFRLASNVRNALYDRGVLKSYDLGAPSVSIGNLTVGGTGKTPLVVLVAGLLADAGESVCVLTRGYGRREPSRRVLVSDGKTVLADARDGGDEPVEIAYKLIGRAAVIADRDRVSAAKWALNELGSTAFVLDDAFQHRRARRDLDIVCIDSTNPFGNGALLPAGTLRESVRNISRAGAIVLTRTDLVRDIGSIENEIRRMTREVPTFQSSNKIIRVRDIGDLRSGPLSGAVDLSPSFFAFCGLGNPLNFFRQLEQKGFKLSGRKTFSDHYFYSQDDISEIERRAAASGADSLITTVKDAVRLFRLRFQMPCRVAEIETVMAEPEAFRELVFSSAARAGRPSKMP